MGDRQGQGGFTIAELRWIMADLSFQAQSNRTAEQVAAMTIDGHLRVSLAHAHARNLAAEHTAKMQDYMDKLSNTLSNRALKVADPMNFITPKQQAELLSASIGKLPLISSLTFSTAMLHLFYVVIA